MTTDSTSLHISADGLVHEALLYRTQAELQDVISGFVHAAQASGEPVLLALPHDHLELARNLLGDSDETVCFADIEQLAHNPSRLIPAIQEWVEDHPGGRVRLVCEPIWPGRSRPETIECLRQEALLNRVLADAPATILCPYDAEHLDPVALDGAELTHPMIVQEGRRRPSSSYRLPTDRELSELWPLEPAPAPASEHTLDGSLHAFRHAVADDPLVSTLSETRRADLVLAVNEAATNAVRHGDHTCIARIWDEEGDLVTELQTGTAASDLITARRPAADALSGRGLWLINLVCDLVQTRTGEDGTTVRMHIRDH
jgi:anti-sigma regulatory factor (Ser/Thr protein kinase)